MKFYFGTSNPYKVRELASIIRPLEVELNITHSIEPKETAKTFEGNAEIKAKEYSNYICKKDVRDLLKRRKGLTEKEAKNFLILNETLTISEDSGIVIPSLGGLPGPCSARFSDFSKIDIKRGDVSNYKKSNLSREEIDKKNNERVLKLMNGMNKLNRSAKFAVSLKVADINRKIVFSSERETHGWIAEEIKGKNGFGYDPIFISESSFGKTWAEIDPMRKNLISHRRKVLQDFTMWLIAQLKRRENL